MKVHPAAKWAGFIATAAGAVLWGAGVSFAGDPGSTGSTGSAASDPILYLSPEEQGRVVDLAEKDASLNAILHGRSLTVVKSGPWTGKGGTRLIGAIARIRLDRPLNGQVVWPAAYYDENSHSGYRRGEHRLKVEGIADLTIMVDFATGEVVNVDPDPTSDTGTAVFENGNAGPWLGD